MAFNCLYSAISVCSIALYSIHKKEKKNALKTCIGDDKKNTRRIICYNKNPN